MSADITTPLDRDLAQALGLSPHPEGGHYRETWRAAEQVRVARAGGAELRAAATAILYLLGPGERSRFHRIDAEELWCWQQGAVMAVHVLDEGGLQTLRVGPPWLEGAQLHLSVPAGAWFAAAPEGGAASLVSCVVAPGFEFRAFTLGERAALTARWPAHAALIAAFT